MSLLKLRPNKQNHLLPGSLNCLVLLLLAILQQAVAVVSHDASDRYCLAEDSPRRWKTDMIEDPACLTMWASYKKRFGLERRAEWRSAHLEDLARTILFMRIEIHRRKQACNPQLAPEHIKGHWWRPAEFCLLGCTQEWEDRRFKEYIRSSRNKIGREYDRKPAGEFSEYTFRKWLFALRLRSDEFQRCAGGSFSFADKRMDKTLNELDEERKRKRNRPKTPGPKLSRATKPEPQRVS